MAQTLFLPPLAIPSYSPSSPDPTPLRMLAFSVAEAALKPDPNSPSFGTTATMSSQPHNPPHETGSRTDSWVRGRQDNKVWSAAGDGERRNTRRPLWNMAERAKERKDRSKVSPAHSDTSLPPSPPISPNYKFRLPTNSSLAASIEATVKNASPSLSLARRFPLHTRSAEPSPTNPTFFTLDQSRPPPEFVPRLSAQDFSARQPAANKHQRTKSDVSSPKIDAPPSQLLRSQVKAKAQAPSLKQIQAKMSKTHRRGGSVGTVPMPKLKTVTRSDSEDSVEVLKTPTDEKPRIEARIRLSDVLSRRPSTPPSPSVKESRLAPFLRERTSGRLAGARPVSMPPVEAKILRPTLKVTPPSFRSISPPTATVTPTRASFPFRTVTPSPADPRFNLAVSTPPAHSSDLLTSPASPTGSIASFRSSSTASPTLSVPIITCTPAPIKVVKNGVEHDSDDDEGEVVVFDGDAEDIRDREEREKRGKEMRDRLRRRLSE